MTAPNPLDMNAVVAGMVEKILGERTPVLIAQALLVAGNSLRAQAFGMTGAINVSEFATPPAQLADGSAIGLLTALKNVPGSFRLFVTAVKLDDGTSKRSILVVDEVEGALLQTKFLTLSDETLIELNRQLVAVQLPDDGTIELCLAIINQPIEGFEYADNSGNSITVAKLAETPPATDAVEPAAPAVEDAALAAVGTPEGDPSADAEPDVEAAPVVAEAEPAEADQAQVEAAPDAAPAAAAEPAAL